LACVFDRRWLGQHMQYETHDPEGLLSTLPAIATTLIGVLAGRGLISRRPETRKVEALAAGGAVLAVLGYVWRLWFPLNKQLWTSSYAAFTSGVTLVGFAACHWLVEARGWKSWARPLEVLGRNALLAYFASGLFYGLQEYVDVQRADGGTTDLKLWLTDHLFGSWLAPKDASLAYALFFLGVCWLFMALLYRKKMFLKV
jgi:predicted acyltransferase